MASFFWLTPLRHHDPNSFVLQKALQLGKKPIVVINKVDKPNCRPEEVHEEVFELMFNLDATEEQLNFPTNIRFFKTRLDVDDWKKPSTDIAPLLDCIVKNIPAPIAIKGTPQMLITSLEYSSYVGRIAIGGYTRRNKEGQMVSLVKRDHRWYGQKLKNFWFSKVLVRKKLKKYLPAKFVPS
jgi:GTP-binding protein